MWEIFTRCRSWKKRWALERTEGPWITQTKPENNLCHLHRPSIFVLQHVQSLPHRFLALLLYGHQVLVFCRSRVSVFSIGLCKRFSLATVHSTFSKWIEWCLDGFLFYLYRLKQHPFPCDDGCVSIAAGVRSLVQSLPQLYVAALYGYKYTHIWSDNALERSALQMAFAINYRFCRNVEENLRKVQLQNVLDCSVLKLLYTCHTPQVWVGDSTAELYNGRQHIVCPEQRQQSRSDRLRSLYCLWRTRWADKGWGGEDRTCSEFFRQGHRGHAETF